MKITGSNVVTLNQSELTKDLQLKHGDSYMELITTKEGIAFTIGHNCELVRNGDCWVVKKKRFDKNEMERI